MSINGIVVGMQGVFVVVGLWEWLHYNMGCFGERLLDAY